MAYRSRQHKHGGGKFKSERQRRYMWACCPTGSEALGSQPGHVQEHVGEAPSRSTVHQEGAVEPGTPPQALIGRPVLPDGPP
jgi:hypothetical protein